MALIYHLSQAQPQAQPQAKTEPKKLLDEENAGALLVYIWHSASYPRVRSWCLNLHLQRLSLYFAWLWEPEDTDKEISRLVQLSLFVLPPARVTWISGKMQPVYQRSRLATSVATIDPASILLGLSKEG